MLIRTATLQRIKSGEVTMAFRRWQRPTVKAGGTLNTAIGQLAIHSVEKVSIRQITAADARSAGYASKKELQAELDKRDGDIYKIRLAYAGADPRIRLRNNDDLSEDELTNILDRLKRMDSRATSGSWTLSVMAAISAHPKTLAAE